MFQKTVQRELAFFVNNGLNTFSCVIPNKLNLEDRIKVIHKCHLALYRCTEMLSSVNASIIVIIISHSFVEGLANAYMSSTGKHKIQLPLQFPTDDWLENFYDTCIRRKYTYKICIFIRKIEAEG